METLVTRHALIAARYSVEGMTCRTCARNVEAALARLPGVRAVQVDWVSGSAVIEFADRPPAFQMMRQAVADAGFALDYEVGDATHRRLPVRPVLFGLVAVAALLGVYLGLITLAQGWAHAVEQLGEDRWFVGVIAAGFGTQVGLFAYLRSLHGKAMAGGVAASSGTSTAAMLACCAHHLTDVLPVLGLSGAAVLLNAYKTPLLWLGIVMNVAGVTYMWWQIRRQRASACVVTTQYGEDRNVAG